MTRLLSSLLAATDAPPFAVIHREHESTLDVLVGDVVDVDRLADIPLGDAEVLALVPFRQVRERGFAAHDDDAPIRCLVVRERESVAVDDAVRLLPRHPVIVDDLDVDVTDEEYAAIVRRVIDDEIGRGEGANFVIRREFTGSTDAAPATAVLGWLRALLEHESGAYWTFALCTPGARRGGGDARAARLVDRRGRLDEPHQRHLPARRRRSGRRRVPRLPRRREGAGGARDGRRRGAEDDERGVPRRRSHPGPVPEADVAAHAHRVPPRGAVGPRPARGAAPHDVRTHGDRVADGQRLCGDRTPRDDASRVLRGRARALHAAPGRASTSTRRSSSARRTSTAPDACACPWARRSCGTPTRRARSPRRGRRPPACSRRSAPSRGRAAPRRDLDARPPRHAARRPQRPPRRLLAGAAGRAAVAADPARS